MEQIKTNKNIISAVVTVVLYEQGDNIMALCPALDLSSYGKTETEAIEAFKEALDIFLEYCEENNTLEENLIACGWQLMHGYQQPEKVIVPLELLKARSLHFFDQTVSLLVA